jgi:hypothetical protein
MDPTRIRRLTMRDAMLLIAAAGIGLAVFQVVVRTLLGGWFRWESLLSSPPRGWTAGSLMVRAVEWIAPSLPFASAWTFAVPVLRLLPPRPSVRRVLRQPGTTACLAAIFGLIWAATGLGETLAVMRLVHGRVTSPPFAWCFHFVVEELFAYLGLAVSAAWLGQALSGRWRPVPDWIDRLGRLLGAYWIVVGLAWACRRYLEIVIY